MGPLCLPWASELVEEYSEETVPEDVRQLDTAPATHVPRAWAAAEH